MSSRSAAISRVGTAIRAAYVQTSLDTEARNASSTTRRSEKREK